MILAEDDARAADPLAQLPQSDQSASGSIGCFGRSCPRERVGA